MVCSTLLRNGINHLHVTWNKGMREWMESHEYGSVRQMQGSMSQLKCADPRKARLRGLSTCRPVKNYCNMQ